MTFGGVEILMVQVSNDGTQLSTPDHQSIIHRTKLRLCRHDSMLKNLPDCNILNTQSFNNILHTVKLGSIRQATRLNRPDWATIRGKGARRRNKVFSIRTRSSNRSDSTASIMRQRKLIPGRRRNTTQPCRVPR